MMLACAGVEKIANAATTARNFPCIVLLLLHVPPLPSESISTHYHFVFCFRVNGQSVFIFSIIERYCVQKLIQCCEIVTSRQTRIIHKIACRGGNTAVGRGSTCSCGV